MFYKFVFIDSRSQFTRYRSWNTRLYPVWKDGDPRFRNCWSGEALFFFHTCFVGRLPHQSSSNDKNAWNCVLSPFEGGQVTFDLKNDGPTLTGARATFSVSLNFPPNQTVLPDGQVVWAQNCTVNGTFFTVKKKERKKDSSTFCKEFYLNIKNKLHRVYVILKDVFFFFYFQKGRF